MYFKRAAKICLAASVLLTASLAYAAYYPVAGEYSPAYERVFSKIKAGECSGMDSELSNLEEKEGVSPDLYLAICYFEKGDQDEGYKTINRMVENEEYDEALYVLNEIEGKSYRDNRLAKYKGIALYSMGNLEGALNNFKSYLEKEDDPEVSYQITDIYTNTGELESAKEALSNIPQKDDRYRYRSGVIAIKEGKLQTALSNFRYVSKEPYPELYRKAQYFIAEICSANKRFGCAEKAYGNMGESPFTAEKKEELAKKKRLFSGLIGLGEQYDTNVTAVDEDKVENVSEEDSFRTYIIADLRLNFYDYAYDEIRAGMTNYKSWNHSVEEYNASSHKFYGSFYKRYDSFELLLPKLSYAKTYLDGDEYSDVFSIEAKGTYKMDSWKFMLPLRLSVKDYHSDVPEDYNRDGKLYKGGLGVSRAFGGKFIAELTGYLAKEDTDGEYRENTQTELKLSLAARITRSINAQAVFDTILYDYDNLDRSDRYNSLSATLIYKLNESVFFNGGYTFNSNDSDDDINDYTKHVFEVGVNYSF
ncbi:outer membrane beta-barrel protein [Limisalsivibrio acetivorans]|uniref:outer membrane beta-barrel protein n=1 Tax=Limisalsivibrio acetivorans TaxID=1304888 RepID=UPI0003B55E35|nr:outer membrane beta-barrel protein [Limisalsivibrio acetivorans]